MNRYNKQKHLNVKDLIYRFIVTIIAITIVCSYLPRDDRYSYQFDLDKPWRYSQLIASFDFPIYKSPESIQKEQDSIMRYYKPYFALYGNIGTEQSNRISELIKKESQDKNASRFLSQIKNILDDIYQRGIISTEDFQRAETDSISFVRIYSGNEAKEIHLSNIYTPKTAYEYLISQVIGKNESERGLLKKYNLNDYIQANLVFDKTKSEEDKKNLLSSLSYSSGMVISGQKIIDRGDIVDENTYLILTSLEKEYSKRHDEMKQSRIMLLGQILYVSIIAFCLMLFFSMFRRDYLISSRKIFFLTIIPVIYPLLTSFLIKHNLFSVYIIPYAMGPIFIRVFMDSRTAFVTHVSTILICAVTLKYPYEFIATQIVSGMVAIYSLRELSQRSQLIKTALYITISAIVVYAGIELIHERDFTHLDYRMYVYIMLNGVALLFAYPLLFILEKVFGFTSNVTLVELSNINNQLLRRMSEVAPGTFQHSLQVANLATAVANKIGAKSQLIRTGALYHDIGKINHPVYFTENQKKINPHERLTNEQSAGVVINHVKEGIKLAEKHKLPQVIKDFITTHHGLGKTKFFLISSINENPDKPVDETLFTYPGPNPFTLEQAILMMADAVEAASRSLSDYTEENISNLVDKIVDTQVNEGFFKDCPITFQDITIAKDVFKDKLKTVYHTRISYPELKKD